MYPVEEIPDSDVLFLRIHKGLVKDRAPIHQVSAFFKPDKVTRKDPADYGVVSLVAGKVRQIEETTVTHTPFDDNRAHTDIRGPGSPEEANTEVRFQLAKLVQWRLWPSSHS